VESRYLTVLYYLCDSAACPQGDLPWSSIEISASPEVVDASFLMSISHMYKIKYYIAKRSASRLTTHNSQELLQLHTHHMQNFPQKVPDFFASVVLSLKHATVSYFC